MDWSSLPFGAYRSDASAPGGGAENYNQSRLSFSAGSGLTLPVAAVVAMNFLCETAVLLFFCVTGGLAIHCYECNSRYDRSCGDDYQRKGVSTVDCDLKLKAPHLEGMNSTVCRKIVHNVRGHRRIVRSCGWMDDREEMAGQDCMRKAGTYEVMLYYCSCYEDNCNSASGHKMSLLLLVTAAISWLLHLRA